MTRRGDDSGQIELCTGDGLRSTVADRCLLSSASEYLNGMGEHPRDQALPRKMDELSFACLLICTEHENKLSPSVSTLLNKCRDAARDRDTIATYDLYPWALAIEAVAGKITSESTMVDRLVGNLTHGSSSVRGFMFELGWFVRKWLPRDESAPLLLKNVAETLGVWWLSLGLCSLLFETNDEFWAYADAHILGDDRFERQYRDRLKLVRDAGLELCLCDLYRLDSRVRKLIEDYALGLRCHE